MFTRDNVRIRDMSSESDILSALFDSSNFPLLPKPYGLPHLSAEVVLRDDSRELFIRLYDTYALISLQRLRNIEVKPQWSLIRDNPSGYWSRGPTGMLVFTHAKGSFEEQAGGIVWNEIQNGKVFSRYQCLRKKILSESASKACDIAIQITDCFQRITNLLGLSAYRCHTDHLVQRTLRLQPTIQNLFVKDNVSLTKTLIGEFLNELLAFLSKFVEGDMVHIRKWDLETSHTICMDLGLFASYHARLNILEDILLGHSAATHNDRIQDIWEKMFANDEKDCRSLMVLDDESRGMVEEAFRKSRDDRERLRQRWKDYFSQMFDNNAVQEQIKSVTEENENGKSTIQFSSILLTDIELGDVLGDGVFSRVYAACIKDDINASDWPVGRKKDLALKLYRTDSPYQRQNVTSETSQKAFRRELRVMHLVKCRHVVPIHAAVIKTGNDADEYICGLVMERCIGSLSNAIYEDTEERQRLAPWNVRMKVQVLRECLVALTYMHRLGVIHRDLKPDNILVCRDGSIKITDFGFSKVVGDFATLMNTSSNAHFSMKGLKGTPLYMAPEIIFADSVKNVVYSNASDIYSLGILANEMMDGKMPFVEVYQQEDFKALLKNGRRPVLFALPDSAEPESVQYNCSVLHTLFQQMWAADRHGRPSATALLYTVDVLLECLRGERPTQLDIDLPAVEHPAHEEIPPPKPTVFTWGAVIGFVLSVMVGLVAMFWAKVIVNPDQSSAIVARSWRIQSSLSDGSISWCNKDNSQILLKLDIQPSNGHLLFNHFDNTYGSEVSIPRRFFRDDPMDAVVSVNDTGFQVWMDGELQHFFEHRLPWTSFHHVKVQPDKPFKVTPLFGDGLQEMLLNQSTQSALWLSQNESWSVHSDSCAGALDFKSAEGHIVFHFNPRIAERQIVMNTHFTHRGWDIPEERLDLPHSCYQPRPYLNAFITINTTGFHVTYMLDRYQEVSYMYAHRLHAPVSSRVHPNDWKIEAGSKQLVSR